MLGPTMGGRVHLLDQPLHVAIVALNVVHFHGLLVPDGLPVDADRLPVGKGAVLELRKQVPWWPGISASRAPKKNNLDHFLRISKENVTLVAPGNFDFR